MTVVELILDASQRACNIPAVQRHTGRIQVLDTPRQRGGKAKAAGTETDRETEGQTGKVLTRKEEKDYSPKRVLALGRDDDVEAQTVAAVRTGQRLDQTGAGGVSN